jgi:hypothetical protein
LVKLFYRVVASASGGLSCASRDRDEGRSFAMAHDLSYDMMLEVQGLIRSLAVRMNVDRELRVGDTCNLLGRDWIVSTFRVGDKEGLDRRLVAREAIEAA